MNFHKDMLLLYAVTDQAYRGEKTLLEQVEEALSSGITLLQLREKDMDKEEFLKEAKAVRALTRHYGIPLLINDDMDIALACEADGVHVGQDDMSASEVRKRIGPNKILGVTAKTPEQARKAYEDGADYIGAGAVFPSPTKADALPMTREQLSAICSATPLPVTAIGGITLKNVTKLQGTGIAGISVVSGIFGQANISDTVRSLKEEARKVVAL
ncbi:thiamine-phosphate synthase [Lacrimispora xylanolytica]|uniref:Thiamine-phosphate synthase n=1 Tax=Lacrimispora xylanolytica TaxID=29375 RepID=A0ABY7ADY4_9FIRM|nr:thiamine phosphate synthase [Lacrimispora xylanolytica]WAJ24662.1 thiamine phosphate synthase [Lacrimispora xylanolytica]